MFPIGNFIRLTRFNIDNDNDDDDDDDDDGMLAGNVVTFGKHKQFERCSIRFISLFVLYIE